MIKITLNGETAELEKPLTINQLIDSYDMNRETVVVELNGELPDKADYDTLLTKENDTIELIRFVGGG